MVDYTRVAVSSVLLLIIGVVLLAFSNSVVIPGRYETFLGIPYASNPEYALALIEKLCLIVFGIGFIVGAGLNALMGVAYGHYRVSHPQPPTRYSSTSSPPPPPSQKRYCVHCGAENPLEASFCHKCGEKLV